MSIITDKDKYLDSIPETGVLTFASRTKRMTDMLFGQVQDLYEQAGLNFKPMWFAFLLTLKHGNGLDIKTLAERRRITHSAASQIVKDLAKNGLVEVAAEKHDLRQKKVTITEEGRKTLYKLIPHLQLVQETLNELLGDDMDAVFRAMDRLEFGLKEQPFKARRLSKLEGLEITDYKSEYRDAFERFYRSWIEQYFAISEKDEELFSNPEAVVSAQGGFILMATYEGEPVGALDTLPHNEKVIELVKIGVDDSLQGRGVGGELVRAAMAKAKEQGYEEMIVETDTTIPVAPKMFRKLGFIDDIRKNHAYVNRGNMWLKIKL